ncbi:DUF4268 domain-containing protein [filamentous cyanobacterium CCP5]|nr:DUF4268 domain-containing protein [filamentous cyanobacterium CCP5]
MPKQPARPRLRRLEQIQPVDFWQEQADFIRWMADADTLQLLGEALGFELRLADGVDLEQAIADQGEALYCQDMEQDQAVLIVPQLQPHQAAAYLGQVVTGAAAGLPIVVWVASDFSAQHQQTLAWLNQVGRPTSRFWAIAVDVWKIGKDAAANFTLVVQPKTLNGASTPTDADLDFEPESELEPEPEPLTETQEENLAFWNQLCERLERRGSIIKAGAPVTDSAMGFAIARADFRLYGVIDREHQSFHAELLLSGEDAHPHFYLLAQEQDRITAAIGLPLVWDDSDPKTCSIYCTLTDVDVGDCDRWKGYQNWLCDCLERFYETFSDRIKRLDAADYRPMPDYGVNPLPNSLILPS